MWWAPAGLLAAVRAMEYEIVMLQHSLLQTQNGATGPILYHMFDPLSLQAHESKMMAQSSSKANGLNSSSTPQGPQSPAPVTAAGAASTAGDPAASFDQSADRLLK